MNWKTLKARVRIETILAASGKLQGLHRRENRLIGPCPLHGGDNPTAFTVDRSRDLWFCFTRCNTGGDSLDLAFRLCGRSWPATARWLHGLCSNTIATSSPAGATPARPSPAIVAPQRRVFSPFTATLRLEPVHPFFRQRGLTPATLRLFEAGVWPGRGFLDGMCAVRLHNLDGRPLGYAGRRLDPAQIPRLGKWKWPAGYPKASLLYNWHRARQHLQAGIVIVESPWSVMRLAQEGLPNAVALCGLSLSTLQASLLLPAPHVVLLLDADPPGQQSTRRILATRFHPRLHALCTPPGTDPADLDAHSMRALVSAIANVESPGTPQPAAVPASNSIQRLHSRNRHDQRNDSPPPTLAPTHDPLQRSTHSPDKVAGAKQGPLRTARIQAPSKRL